MAIFQAYAEYITVLRIELEADNLEEAMQRAIETDSDQWETIDFDSWHITDIVPLKE
jgi:hypothetical protein